MSSASIDIHDQGAVLILDELVRRAVARRASDIHLEPKPGRMQVRMRVDGAMVDEQSVGPDLAPLVVSRIKVLARMDIAERRVPQDGTLTIDVPHLGGTAGPPEVPPGGKRVHLRASTFPCSYGEKVVLRVLLGQTLIPFAELGLDETQQGHVREIIGRPQGLLVTAGPTGSGKTSTLYSCMELVDTARNNVVTLEDPIEVEIPGITQGQAHTRAGFTFAVGLRAILRQDPDVILVGEIRDGETAQIALQAALTGHLVMTTLHTSDVMETIVRLVDLGIEPWIVGSALSAVCAQRLVRKICDSCRDTAKLDEDLWDGDEVLLPAGSTILRPRGCARCFRTGYRGRVGIFEMLLVDDEVRELIKAKASTRDYRRMLASRKLQSLRRLGFERVREGVTTIDEVRRVT
jgi:general secretion pathway protein E/type IV pilus assembly protein PilB